MPQTGAGFVQVKDYNKFQEMKLTPGKAAMVQAPLIEESPLCIECRVKEIVALGSHHMFIADVVNVKADDKYLNSETGKFELAQSNLLVYATGILRIRRKNRQVRMVGREKEITDL